MSDATLPTPQLTQAIRRKLLRWYDTHARDLPWRRRAADAYAAWVAEIMLQQTQVETVIPYYERFMARFATVESLAKASQETLMRHWQGLGYYRRALNLHRAAKQIAAGGGTLPDTVGELIRLPGVGRYTAGAIASIAFGRRAAAVDGNVSRVLSRLFNIKDEVTRPDTIRRLWSIAEQLAPPKRCGDFNQAWMDLGSTVCVPGVPLCDTCPLAGECVALRDGEPADLPVKRAKKSVARIRLVALVVHRNDSFLMSKRPVDGLWGGLWEFPNRTYAGPGDRMAALCDLSAELGIGSDGTAIRRGTIEHQLTHRLMCFDVYSTDAAASGFPRGMKWVRSSRLADLPMSAACRKMLALILTTSK